MYLYSTSPRRGFLNTKLRPVLHSLERCLKYTSFLDMELTFMSKMTKQCCTCHCARVLATTLIALQYHNMRKSDKFPVKVRDSPTRDTLSAPSTATATESTFVDLASTWHCCVWAQHEPFARKLFGRIEFQSHIEKEKQLSFTGACEQSSSGASIVSTVLQSVVFNK